MRLPVSQLDSLIFEAVSRLRDAACRLARENVADIQIVDDEITIQVELVPDGGWNAISRTTVSEEGEQTTRENRPEMTETQVQDAAVSTTVEQAAVIQRTETRTAQESLQTRTEQPWLKRSTKIEQPTTSTEQTEHTTTHQSQRANNGGDVVRQDYEVEAT